LRAFRFCFIVLILVANNFIVSADSATDPVEENDTTFHIRDHSFLLPQALPAGHYRHAIALYAIVPPRDWTLDIVKAPMFNYSGKYTLPKNFSLQGGISSIIVSTRINAGPFWSYSHKNFHTAVGYQVAFNLGYLSQFGFSTTLTGWEQQPSLTFGYSFDKTAVILRGDLYYTTAINVSEGGHIVKFNDQFLNGYSFTASFEQRLHANRVMSLGLQMDYFRYHIIAWPALPVNSYRYWIPEFHFGLNF